MNSKKTSSKRYKQSGPVKIDNAKIATCKKWSETTEYYYS